MRAPHLITASLALALAACGPKAPTQQAENADQSLTADNIVSNDITAIDAVTGDAANMAADVDMNFGGLDENASDVEADAPDASATATKPKAKKPAPAKKPVTPAPIPSPATATTNEN